MSHIWSILLVALFVACNKPIHTNDEITKVELARSGAWSDFGASISIDSALNYKYFGDYNGVKQGYFVGKISSKFWDTLNRELEQIKFKTLSVSDNRNTVDVNYFELIVHWKKGKRRISRVWDLPLDSVMRVIKWLDNSYRNISLHQVKNPIQFETTFHNLPKPLIKQVEFPPPIIKK